MAYLLLRLKMRRIARAISLQEINEYIEQQFTHFYTVIVDDKLVEIVEINAYYIYSYCKIDDKRKLPKLDVLDGFTSVHLPADEKAALASGQDEAIFRLPHCNESFRTVDREATLRTKGLGVGIMVSTFISCATGFVVDIATEQLVVINITRTDEQYTDEESSNNLYICGNKNRLSEFPFL